MATKELFTRIVLRNDSTVNWNGDAAETLKKGEVGLEFLENGKVKMKVGDDAHTWKDLPYVGGDDAQVFQGDAQDGESDDNVVITRLVGQTEVHPGDMAIVKRTFGNGKVSHTAYVYDGAWKAMDGNYNANNVYFDKDLQTTAPIGNVILTNGQANIEAAGKNLNEVWQSIFVKEKNPAVTQPSASWSGTSSVQYLEIGTEGTANVGLSLDDGNYEYGYDEDGKVVNNGSTGVIATAYHISYGGSEVVSAASGTVKSGKQTTKTSKSASGSIDYSEGKIPVSNTGNKVASLQIKAGNDPVDSNAELFRWYIPMYHGFKYDTAVVADPSKVTNAEIKGLTAITGSTAYNQTVPTADTAKKSWMQYFVAVPASYKRNITGAKDGNNLTLGVAKANDVTINLNGTDVVYNVWYINNAAAYDTLKIELTW